jgi:hypothetical protein
MVYEDPASARAVKALTYMARRNVVFIISIGQRIQPSRFVELNAVKWDDLTE